MFMTMNDRKKTDSYTFKVRENNNLPSDVCDAGWFPRFCLLMRFRTGETADAAIAEA